MLRSVHGLGVLVVVPLILVWGAFQAKGETAKYFYDDSGRLSRVLKGTSGVFYQYDAVGNLLSVTNGATDTGPPVITEITPDTLLVDTKLIVVISGLNFLSIESITSVGGLVDIENVTITDTQITAEMTALSSGIDALRIINDFGQTDSEPLTLSSSVLTFSPGQLGIPIGNNGILSASLNPPLNKSVTFNLQNNEPTIASAPENVTIPPGGMADISVDGLSEGVAKIRAGAPRSTLFVTNPFTGDVAGLASRKLSVRTDAPLNPLSTKIAKPVSVYLDAPLNAPSSRTAQPVSVLFYVPSPPSSHTANTVSVRLNSPPGTQSPAGAKAISVRVNTASTAQSSIGTNVISARFDTPLSDPSSIMSTMVSVQIQ